MGVRGLQTFMEKYCRSPEAAYSIDIAKVTNDFKCRTGRDAKIVVDAQSCYNLWYQGLDWYVGFEIQRFICKLRTFVECFKKLGIQLIFFFGGANVEKKRKTWVERRRKNLEEIHHIFDIIRNGGSTDHIKISVLPNMGLITSYILKFVFGCEVYMSIDECDEEIIKYAHEHQCFAIFGQDTDFVVSQVEAVVLSSKHFNIENMTTVIYNRQRLAHHLQIRLGQLPLLAVLAGNDFVPFNVIRKFHCRVCGYSNNIRGDFPFQVLFPAIGVYINKLPKNVPVEVILKIISEDLFNDDSFQFEPMLKTSYESYFVEKSTNAILSPPKDDEWSNILALARFRHKSSSVPSYLHSILSEQIFEFGTVFEDLRVTHNGRIRVRDYPSSAVTRPLRSCLYGILLFEKNLITVREWCGENIDSFFKPVLVEPKKPYVPHPGLIVLWSNDNSHRINEMRWQLFLTSVSPTLKIAEWQKLDPDLLLASLSVCYLYKVKYLTESEVDIVLATIATYSLYSDEERLKLISYGDLNFRAAQISVTIIRTYGLILTLLAACGYPVSLSSENAFLKFEGKLFQKKYHSFKNKPSYTELFEHDHTSLKIFREMRKLILKGVHNGDLLKKMDKMRL